jgi:tetratricopeptide (TPR) repeat protein
VARAAGLLHYAARHPLIEPPQQLAYGLSYSRRLLRQSGAFPPGLAAGEDTWLNRAARRIARPVWAPEVVTDHDDPATLRDWLRDDRRRARRRAGHAPYRPLAAQDDPAAAVAPIVAARRDIARRLLSRLPDLTGADRGAALAMQWLALQADRAGVLDGLADIATAAARLAAARACLPDRPREALDLIAEARRLDPQDPEMARVEGEALQAGGDPDGAEAAFRAALALAPDDAAAAAALVGLVARRDGAAASLNLAESLCLAAPWRAALWDLAARQALDAGRASWAVVLGRLALLRGIDQPGAHRRLAGLHLAAGDAMAAAFRQRTAARLAERPPAVP